MYKYTERETSSLVVHVISFKVGPFFCECAQEFAGSRDHGIGPASSSGMLKTSYNLDPK